MTLRDSDVQTRDRVGVFEAVVDEAIDRCLSSECAKMLRDIVSRKQLEIFRPGIHGDPPGYNEVQGWCGRSPFLTVLAYRGIRQCCRDRRRVATTIIAELVREGLEDATRIYHAVSGVFHHPNGRTANEIKALRPWVEAGIADSHRAILFVFDHVLVLGGGSKILSCSFFDIFCYQLVAFLN